MHTIKNDQHRPIFYFGKRYDLLDKKYIPLAVQASHANFDLIIFNEFIEKFTNFIIS